MLTTGVPLGTDWTSGELYELDWGENFGKLVRFRYPDEAFGCILPKLIDGGGEIQVGCLPDEVNILRSNGCFWSILIA